jgi:hypothetical protein
MSDMGIGEAMLISSIIGGGASIAGGALANRGSSSTTPTVDPAYSGLQGQILKMIQSRLATPLDTSGYTANGVGTINKSYDLGKQASDNALSARGLSTSPVAGAVDATRENARAGSVATFQNSVPLLARESQGADLSQAAGVLGLGRGSASSFESGGGAAGAFTNLAQYLGYLTGKGVFKGSGAGVLPSTQTVPNMGLTPAGGTGY